MAFSQFKQSFLLLFFLKIYIGKLIFIVFYLFPPLITPQHRYTRLLDKTLKTSYIDKKEGDKWTQQLAENIF